jgi:uncharacterized protein DUF3563
LARAQASSSIGGASLICLNELEFKGTHMIAITRFFTWLGNSADEAERRYRERYLAQATDHADLEIRMRALARADSAGLCRW